MNEQLSGRELDAVIHRDVMCQVWDESRCRACGWALAQSTADGCVAESCSQRPYPAKMADEPPRYSESIEAAMRVEDRIAWLGLIGAYVSALKLIGDRSTSARVITDEGRMWRMAHATPEQRCLAALSALEEKKS